MKKEVILVPKDKCPLDVLAEMGERIRKSWIFLHENAYQYLLKSDGANHSTGNSMNANQTTLITWAATKDYPKTVVFCEVPSARGWGKITSIEAADISFGLSTNDPEDIYFLKMDE